MMKRLWRVFLEGLANPGESSWPKSLPLLTADQQRIRDQFMAEWLAHLPKTYGRLESFNQSYVCRHLPPEPWRVLEIGAGIGAHLQHEPSNWQEYTVVELRPEFVNSLKERFRGIRVICRDIQDGIDAGSGSFNRIMAIHVLEHLPDLPRAIREIKRLLSQDGVFTAVIPCEGGVLYEMARELTTRRQFETRYDTSYDWFARSEHVSKAWEILRLLENEFRVIEKIHWPLHIPSIAGNLVVGVTCRHRN